MSRWDLVVFDFDGVLVDSERIASRLNVEMLASLGVDLTVDECIATFTGRAWSASVAHLEQHHGLVLDPATMTAWDARWAAAMDHELEPVPGVLDALARIDLASCIASNGSLATIDRALRRVGLLDRFAGRVFSAEQVAQPKPEPDLHLHVAEVMGADPARCVVVEDTPTGVSAAVAAGMTALGFADLVPAERLRAAGAAVIFTDMVDLPDLLARPSVA